ncbi:MAG: glycoside hydrolase family 127 protein [Planctomycetota bacterium]|nr:glycoside hydrolase family 127 protein [Planctomycetota bacterium]
MVLRHRIAGFCAALVVAVAVQGEELPVSVVPRPDTTTENPYYPGNKPSLLPSPFIRLPTGAVRPKGWLRRQLELQADGYLGHMSEVSGFLNKRNNAWLSKEGKGDGFWEEVPYWLRGYVSLAYLLDDPKLIEEAKTWLEPSLAGQRPNGYFGTEALYGGGKNPPDLMPHQNMLYAYRSYYDCTGDQRILDLMTRFFHWELTLDDQQFFNGGWGAARNSDNMDMAYWLYNRTGDPKLLELAEKLMRTGDRWMGKLGGCHNVAFSQGFRKPAVFYQQNKDPKFLQAMENNYNDIYDVYGQVPGGMFGGDEFARPGHTDPHQAIETCGAVEMMFSSQILLRITGDLKWMDRCEDIAYNTLPATMTADLRGLRYLTSPNQSNSDRRSKAPTLADAGPMQVMDPRDHHCCQHNVSCAWPYFAESLYEATPDRGLAAMMFAPCTVTAQVGDGTRVTLEQNTRYPFEESVELAVNTPKNVAFPLYLRIPSWCGKLALRLNGTALDVSAKGGDLVRIARTWASGDKLVLDLPMTISLTRWQRNNNSVSVNRGPLTYSIKIGEKYVRTHPELKDDKWPAFEIVPTTPWNYGLVLDAAEPAASFQVTKKEFPASGQPFTTDDAPLELKVKAARVPNWTENYWGVVDKVQASPVKTDQPAETVTMIPMGCGRLRMSALPVIGDGAQARPWTPYQEPISSWSEDEGIIKTVTNPREPKDSDDGGAGMFLMYAPTIAGSKQWIRMPLGEERTVSRAKVYWWTEHYQHGGVREPTSWTLLYKKDGAWVPVPNPSGYGVALNQYNEVKFDPVKTSELKMEIQFQPTRCVAVIRWRVE